MSFVFSSLTSNESLANKEETWDILARKNLIEETEIIKKCEETGQIADFTIAELEQHANKVYFEALDKVNTPKMWNIYIQFCHERLNLNSQFLNEEVFLNFKLTIFKISKSNLLPIEINEIE